MAGSLGTLAPGAFTAFLSVLMVSGGLAYASYNFGMNWKGLGCFAALIAAVFIMARVLSGFFGKYSGRIVFGLWLIAILGTYFGFLFQQGKYPMGIDLAGGTELIYVLDYSDSKRNMELLEKEIQELKGKDPASKELRDKQEQLQGMEDAIKDASNLAAEVVRRRVDPTGTKGIPVTTFGSDRNRLRILLPRATTEEVARIKSAVETQGRLAFHIVVEEEATKEKVRAGKGVSPDGAYVMKEIVTPRKFTDKADDVSKQEIFVKRIPDLDSPKIVRARHRMSHQSAAYEISVLFSAAGQNEFGKLTEMNKKKQLAIVLDGVAHSAPTIQDAIYGECVISGDFDEEKAKKLASVLQAGSLPAVVKYENEFTVGPTLGEEQIQSGIQATVIGTVFVIGFILFYYRLAGAIAAFCTVLNVIMLLGAMGFFKATLTLPGIAGIVLTLGMSVDANVLILERLREELAAGRQLRQAVTSGFGRAFLTIIDCNLTTLISGMILYYLGTGAVRGFAVSLSIGILTTLFCNLWLNWVITEWVVSRDVVQKFNFVQFFRVTNFDFMSVRRQWITGTLVLCVTSLVLLSVFSNRIYDVDFTGGTLIQFNFAAGKEQDGKVIKDEVEGKINQAVSARTQEALKAISQHDLRLTAQTFGRPDANGKYRSFTITTRVTTPEVVEELRKEIVATYKDSLEPEAITVADSALTIRMNSRENLSDADVQKNITVARDDAAEQSANAPIRDALKALQVGTPKREGKEILVAVSPLPTDPAQRLKVVDAISAMKIDDRASGAISRKVTFGAAVADDLFFKSILALAIANLGVFLYVWFRFDFSAGWGIGAIFALVHDVLIAAGGVVVAHLLGMDILIDMNIIAALLTIIGFSVNDTIVVFDRIREVKQAHPTRDYADIVNEAVNATLSRTILTAATVIIATLALLIFGGQTIRGMALTLLIGFVAGMYSSIFVASPVMIWWYKRFGSGKAPVPYAPRTPKAESPKGAEI